MDYLHLRVNAMPVRMSDHMWKTVASAARRPSELAEACLKKAQTESQRLLALSNLLLDLYKSVRLTGGIAQPVWGAKAIITSSSCRQ